MKRLISLAMILLTGCSTANFIISDEFAGLCNTCKVTEKTEVAPVTPTPVPTPVPEQLQNVPQNNIPPQMRQQGWTQKQKLVLCGPLEQVLRSIKNYGERPYMYWQDPSLTTSIMMFRNKEDDTLTVVENPTPQISCVISNGVQLHIEDNSVENGKLREAGKEDGPHVLEIKTKED